MSLLYLLSKKKMSLSRSHDRFTQQSFVDTISLNRHLTTYLSCLPCLHCFHCCCLQSYQIETPYNHYSILLILQQVSIHYKYLLRDIKWRLIFAAPTLSHVVVVQTNLGLNWTFCMKQNLRDGPIKTPHSSRDMHDNCVVLFIIFH